MGGPSNPPPLVNAAGSTLSLKGLGGPDLSGYGLDNVQSFRANSAAGAQMFLNWLTAGGAPKPVDPGSIFTQAQATAPAQQAAAKGQGIGGLFGTGSMIGELAPPVQPIQPLQGIKSMNTSPLQPGVPYSVPALPKVGGR